MVVFGRLRLAVRAQIRKLDWMAMDTTVILWALSRTVIYTLQQQDGQALVYQLGQSFDGVGTYFLFRILFITWEDFERTISSFMWVSIPVALCFMIEMSTG